MAVGYTIQYHEAVVTHDLPKITKAIQQRIRIAIEQKLVVDPYVYGKPLRASLAGYRKLRVGNYRVVFSVSNHTVSVVYKKAQKRT